MSELDIAYEINDDVGTLTISKPPVNALSYEEVSLLREEIHTIPRNDELAVVLRTAGSKVFMGGHDITDLQTTTPTKERDGTDSYLAFLEELYELPIPTIVAIDGWCRKAV